MITLDIHECEHCQSPNLKWFMSYMYCCLDCGNIGNTHRPESPADIVADPNAIHEIHPYSYSIAVHFNTSNKTGMAWIGDDEWKWMINQSRELSKLLIAQDIGYSDGHGSGFGQLDIHLFVNDIDKAYGLIFSHLTDQELMGYCVSITAYDGAENGEWKTLYSRSESEVEDDT